MRSLPISRRPRRLAALVPLFAVVGAFALGGCANREKDADPAASTSTADSAAASFPVVLTPPGGKPVTLDKRPERIVSLTPSSTESLFAIGAGKQVVAVDDQSNFPADAPHSTLSGFKPNVEAIAGKNPDLVVAANDTDQLVANLAKVKIPVLLLPAAAKLDDVYAQFGLLGKATGHVREADELTVKTRDGIDKAVKDTRKPARELRYYHELDPTLYTATSKTFIGQVYALFGLTNIADKAATSDYPQLSAEQVVNANPDLIFLADGTCCGQSAATVAARPGFASLNAVRNGGVVVLGDDIASRWGPRVVDLVQAVASAVAKVK
ncbi:ABC transporter substrate-binding protein [Solihabitans fulvus]|uniref:ABC transporter substrate-binding protein n=1 Tax=Solihabitans fulvus TaxID=1892852 RepID=A0A5B2X6C2_9PSEU|nr:ABC transporter substrate-binding protein [Solihabitans fulvus]KAA2258745.1 ABC transporter substrate-binding protein [Solihabitans fulvus]